VRQTQWTRERTRAQVVKNCPSARAQHTQASHMSNEETKVTRSAADTLALTCHRPESALEA
jgi:hypothetical protein